MAHNKDYDRPPVATPRESRHLSQRLRPDYKRREHPVPREPVDPKAHPSR